MKFMVSYFYQVRFMKPNMLPVSTARWDPGWFHQYGGQNKIFRDKNGVLNGLRADPFAPKPGLGMFCADCTNHEPPCDFLKQYRDQLDKLNFESLMARFERLAIAAEPMVDGYKEEPIIVLLVHEAPNNPCSERSVLIDYFKDHGVPLPEFAH